MNCIIYKRLNSLRTLRSTHWVAQKHSCSCCASRNLILFLLRTWSLLVAKFSYGLTLIMQDPSSQVLLSSLDHIL